MGFTRRFGSRIAGIVSELSSGIAQHLATVRMPVRGISSAIGLPAAVVIGLSSLSAPALAQGSSCAQLEASLASLDRGPNSWAARQSQAARQRTELQNLTSRAKSMGCDAPRGFFIFQGPQRPPQCDQIDDQISRLRSSIAGLEQGGQQEAGQRRALILALAQNNCGQQYTNAVQQGGQRQQQRPRNFLEAIFGAPVESGAEDTIPDVDISAVEPARTSYSRTVCVRTCDGYFFPLSRGSNPSRFEGEDQLCKRLCPAADTQLFSYSGDDIRSAVSMSGENYMSLPNALRYRKELVQDCSCRAPGQSWAQALDGIENESTLRKGDILVTEQQAKEMSKPKFASKPGTPRKDPAQTGSAPVTATSEAPLAPAAEQPGQRPVRIIPLPRSRNLPQEPALGGDD
ncbi:DUF2865 domain-containing protein [Xanthobacter sp. TB0136]|uniref:DUF2865 domain-containing protein n=1 Tax=Xanthobacter sp. TB0136 TaxID=3459177 RepID=UPI00403A723F